MGKVLVTINPKPELFSEIDFRQPEWSSLLPQNLSNFKMEELRRPCEVYPDGIFPGAERYRDNKQISKIRKFQNYVEFCKVVADEVVPLGGQLFLTSKFYDRRKEGWSSDVTKKKEGEVVAYCLNGDLYCAADKPQADQIFYGVVYESLVSKDPAFMKLRQSLLDGVCLELTGADDEFLNRMKTVLLKGLESGSS